MLCCLGLFAGFYVGSALGGPWALIAPAAGFTVGLIGDTKLMHGSHGGHSGHGGLGGGCCGSGHSHSGDIGGVKDPVCGMEVDEKITEYTVVFQGKTYYFCSQDCMSTFKNDPERYVK